MAQYDYSVINVIDPISEQVHQASFGRQVHEPTLSLSLPDPTKKSTPSKLDIESIEFLLESRFIQRVFKQDVEDQGNTVLTYPFTLKCDDNTFNCRPIKVNDWSRRGRTNGSWFISMTFEVMDNFDFMKLVDAERYFDKREDEKGLLIPSGRDIQELTREK